MWLVLCFAMTALVFASDDNKHAKSKVLMLIPFGGKSHRICFLPLAKALADKGHLVTIISILPPVFNHTNIEEIHFSIKVPPFNMMDVRSWDPTLGFTVVAGGVIEVAKHIYDDPAVWELYKRRHEFDVMIIDELFSEATYPFLVGKRYMSIATPGVIGVASSTMGNVLNPAYSSGMSYEYPRPYSIWSKLHNLFVHLEIPFYWRIWKVFPEVQEILKKRFPDLPPLAEIERGLSVVLSNNHFSLDIPMPLLPSQVDVGGMHIKAPKELPQDLKNFLDSSERGVVYFSLGSIIPGSQIPEHLKSAVLETLKKLPYDILWKFDEEVKDVPSKFLIKKWMPQQDILAHPKVKLFLTHGGLLSLQEAVFHAKPLVALPIFADQERNAQRIRSKNLGDFVLWEELTVDKLYNTINRVISDPKYLKSVHRASEVFRDQPQTPLERAVWWTEYVIRHKGAPHLECPASKLSWVEYFMIDVLIVICATLLGVCFLLKKLTMMIITKVIFSSRETKDSKKKRS